jgi:hypothetical protein
VVLVYIIVAGRLQIKLLVVVVILLMVGDGEPLSGRRQRLAGGGGAVLVGGAEPAGLVGEQEIVVDGHRVHDGRIIVGRLAVDHRHGAALVAASLVAAGAHQQTIRQALMRIGGDGVMRVVGVPVVVLVVVVSMVVVAATMRPRVWPVRQRVSILWLLSRDTVSVVARLRLGAQILVAGKPQGQARHDHKEAHQDHDHQDGVVCHGQRDLSRPQSDQEYDAGQHDRQHEALPRSPGGQVGLRNGVQLGARERIVAALLAAQRDGALARLVAAADMIRCHVTRRRRRRRQWHVDSGHARAIGCARRRGQVYHCLLIGRRTLTSWRC